MVHGAWCMVHGAWCMVHNQRDFRTGLDRSNPIQTMDRGFIGSMAITPLLFCGRHHVFTTSGDPNIFPQNEYGLLRPMLISD